MFLWSRTTQMKSASAPRQTMILHRRGQISQMSIVLIDPTPSGPTNTRCVHQARMSEVFTYITDAPGPVGAGSCGEAGLCSRFTTRIFLPSPIKYRLPRLIAATLHPTPLYSESAPTKCGRLARSSRLTHFERKNAVQRTYTADGRWASCATVETSPP